MTTGNVTPSLDDPAKYVDDHWVAIKQNRAATERKWQLCHAMLHGRQYVEYDTANGSFRDIVSKSTPRRRRRVIRNHMIRFYSSVLGRLVSRSISPTVNPNAFSSESVTASMLARMLCAVWLQQQNLALTNIRSLAHAVAWGKGYIKTLWDETAGPVDPQTGAPDGDVKWEPVSPFNVAFYPETAEFTFEARGGVEARLMPIEEIRRIYGVKPEKALSQGIGGEMLAGLDVTPWSNAVGMSDKMGIVKELMELPGKTFPQGLHVIIAGTDVVKVGVYPYEALAKARLLCYDEVLYRYIPESPEGRGLLVDLAQPQLDYNRLLSQEMEFRDSVAGGGRPMLPHGCGLDARSFDDEPGPLTFKTVGNNVQPYTLQMPQWDPGSNRTALDCLTDMEHIASQHEVSSGTVPRNIESGVAIEALQEGDSQGMMAGIKISESLGLAGALRKGLVLAQQYYTVERTLETVGPDGIPFYFEGFKGADIASLRDVWVEIKSPMPYSRAAQHEKIMSLAQQGVLKDREEILNLLDIGMPNGVVRLPISMDALQAARENDMMRRGEYVSVEDFDDHPEHVQVHNAYRRMPWFRTWPDEHKNTFNEHCKRHEQNIAMAEEQAMAKQIQMAQAGVKPGRA